jgi:hypothetical protein
MRPTSPRILFDIFFSHSKFKVNENWRNLFETCIYLSEILNEKNLTTGLRGQCMRQDA